MSEIETGGPAFPLSTVRFEDGLGMTLRDYFAAKAMQGMLSDLEVFKAMGDGPRGASAELSTCAYEMADAMLKARKS